VNPGLTQAKSKGIWRGEGATVGSPVRTRRLLRSSRDRNEIISFLIRAKKRIPQAAALALGKRRPKPLQKIQALTWLISHSLLSLSLSAHCSRTRLACRSRHSTRRARLSQGLVGHASKDRFKRSGEATSEPCARLARTREGCSPLAPHLAALN